MTSNSGAVFFLGSRAHYQVLQQPDSQSYDLENGNASTETIYQNPSARDVATDNADYGERNWNYDQDSNMTEEKEKSDMGNGMKRRTKRRSSETTLCERDNDMRPALLNNIDSSTPKAKTRRRIPVLSFLSSLGRRRRLEQAQYLQHIESALAACTYRGSCRCLDCQSRYFECDESEGYSSDESEYSAPRQREVVSVQQYDEEEDDEVFIDTVPGDNTSTDMLLETTTKETTTHMSASSCETEEDAMQLEVAAGTPSRYFECDESEGYSSDESEYSAPRQREVVSVQQYDEEEDDEVFIDTVPGDNTSTDMLLETTTKETTTHMSASSCETEEDAMQLEVAAGTPVLLNYLLTHPVTCAIQ